MSSTPLLAAAGLPGLHVMQDHPVFLRASHSPWRCIPQNVLVVLRGIVLAYLTASSAMILHYKLTEESDKALAHHLFDFSLISQALVFLYHLVTFSWTFTHLYYPDPDDNEGGLESWIIKAMSLPRNMASQRKQFYFTMFYSTSSVFAFMNSVVYWFITRQHEAADGAGALLEAAAATGTGILTTALTANASALAPIPDAPFSDLFGEGWFKPFVVVNLHGATSLIMVLEMLLFNSIKRPSALGSHFFGLIFNSGLYLAWAALGKALTGESPFFWLDADEVGSKEAVTVYCMGFVLLAPIMYTMMLGFVGIRQGLTKARSGRGAQEELDS